MRPEEIEEMLYHRAVRSKIRPHVSKRISNLALHRAVATTAMAGTALLAALALRGGDSQSNAPARSNRPSQPLMTDTKQNIGPSYTDPNQMPNSEPITASLAMTR